MENIDWGKLSFGYMKTNYNVRCYYRNGKWGQLEVSSSEDISMHMAATCLHYGQEAFEGLKCYRGKDGKVRIFRWIENSHRLQSSAEAAIELVKNFKPSFIATHFLMEIQALKGRDKIIADDIRSLHLV